MGLLTRIWCFLLVIKYVFSLQFYLKEGQSLCFGENIAPNAKVLAEYTVAAGSGHMPVDIIVRDLAENKTLYEKNDINHGKFAFIAPFGEELPHIHTADLERKDHHGEGHHHEHHDHHGYEHEHNNHEHEHDHGHHEEDHHHNHDSPPEHDHGHDWDHNNNHHENEQHHDEGAHHRQTRGLLSFDEHEHEHHRAPPEAHNPHEHHDFEHHHDHDREHHDHNDNPHHHESHYNDHASRDYHEHGEHGGEHGEKKLDHMDAHDGEHGNMEEEWDMDKYDGIHDEDLEKDWNENEQKHPEKHDHDIDEDDFTREAALFKERKFEICLTSPPNNSNGNSGLSRRVRLHLRHGKAAHDYTRLAKKEHLSSLELTLRIVSDELKELHTELDHARQLEDSLRILNENTSRRVVHYATFSMLVLLGVSAFQAMYTKRFFKTKKLL